MLLLFAWQPSISHIRCLVNWACRCTLWQLVQDCFPIVVGLLAIVYTCIILWELNLYGLDKLFFQQNCVAVISQAAQEHYSSMMGTSRFFFLNLVSTMWKLSQSAAHTMQCGKLITQHVLHYSSSHYSWTPPICTTMHNIQNYSSACSE